MSAFAASTHPEKHVPPRPTASACRIALLSWVIIVRTLARRSVGLGRAVTTCCTGALAAEVWRAGTTCRCTRRVWWQRVRRLGDGPSQQEVLCFTFGPGGAGGGSPNAARGPCVVINFGLAWPCVVSTALVGGEKSSRSFALALSSTRGGERGAVAKAGVRGIYEWVVADSKMSHGVVGVVIRPGDPTRALRRRSSKAMAGSRDEGVGDGAAFAAACT